MERIVIIGAGQAGLSAAGKLRQLGFAGSITLLGKEGVAPYQRPPLSKAYLLGKMDEERLALRGANFFEANAIDAHFDLPALAVDARAREVLTSGPRFAYDHLILAQGADPIELPAPMTEGIEAIFYLRNKADADRLRAHLKPESRVLVVGGGYVGLEVAASARMLGASVTLVELSKRILNRVAADPTARFFRDLHRANGVDLREGTGLESLGPAGDHILAGLSDGSSLEVDAVVIGIGVRPQTALAEAAGLKIAGGIIVDDYGRTSDPAIWAAGDCAVFPHEGGMIRLESVPHAIDQAEHVAANILGAEKPYRARPWFWSDQYDTKLQIAGLNLGYTHVEEKPGANPGSLSVHYFDGDKLLAVDCLNDARSFMQAKKQILG